jgi:hypothetical protein
MSQAFQPNEVTATIATSRFQNNNITNFIICRNLLLILKNLLDYVNFISLLRLDALVLHRPSYAVRVIDFWVFHETFHDLLITRRCFLFQRLDRLLFHLSFIIFHTSLLLPLPFYLVLRHEVDLLRHLVPVVYLSCLLHPFDRHLYCLGDLLYRPTRAIHRRDDPL